MDRFYNEYLIWRTSGFDHAQALEKLDFLSPKAMFSLLETIAARASEREGTFPGLVDEAARRSAAATEITEPFIAPGIQEVTTYRKSS